ncbi:helix-turn-helix domain-containing protein [Planktotalea sp.]|uniref:helix-turn-helix domain-containing protein n=1 Tax=Planktotalea sp. TaxID=2029877 RepID=UPI003D6AAB4F
MYDPKGNGKDKAVQSVQFTEVEPPSHLRGIVHRYLELKTESPLQEDYRFHALPDACSYVVFDQMNPNVTGVAKLRAESEEFNLGTSFHFINIRFLPGVWQSENEHIIYGMLDRPYVGTLPLIELNREITTRGFDASQPLLTQLVEQLIESKHVAANPVTEKIFQHLDDIHNVADMAECVGISARQLQRTLKRTTDFTPHDFLKVLRVQQSLNGKDTWSYADQSHFIHSFRRATGYTPGKYAKKFDV